MICLSNQDPLEENKFKEQARKIPDTLYSRPSTDLKKHNPPQVSKIAYPQKKTGSTKKLYSGKSRAPVSSILVGHRHGH